MKINKFIPFKNVVIVDDAATIRRLNDDENVDRQFQQHNLLNRFTLTHSLKNLSFKGWRFPHMLPKQDEVRIKRHTELWNLFNEKSGAMAEGPEELENIAKWIRREIPGENPGVLAQQVIGQFFNPNFKASEETWKASLLFHADALLTNPFKIYWWRVLGKANKAKEILALATNNDIVAMHGIGVAVHNLVASIQRLRQLYDDTITRENTTPEKAVNLSLSAPPVVLRQALAKGSEAGCPYSKFTLFMMRLKDANTDNNAKDLIFMSNSWSRCPAEQWIPAVIAGIWKRVILIK